MTRSGARQESVKADNSVDIVGVVQGGGGSGRTLNGVAILAKRTGQVEVPAEYRANVSAHGFWNWGTTAIFDILIVNLDADSYLSMTPEKTLAKTEKEKKAMYIQVCLDLRRTCTPMVYPTDGIPEADALAA